MSVKQATSAELDLVSMPQKHIVGDADSLNFISRWILDSARTSHMTTIKNIFRLSKMLKGQFRWGITSLFHLSELAQSEL